MSQDHETLDNLLRENRTFPPSTEFAENSNITADLYTQADADRLGFWEQQARELDWDTDFTEVLDWSDAPFAKWFVGGTLNVAYNCVDRHVCLPASPFRQSL